MTAGTTRPRWNRRWTFSAIIPGMTGFGRPTSEHSCDSLQTRILQGFAGGQPTSGRWRRFSTRPRPSASTRRPARRSSHCGNKLMCVGSRRMSLAVARRRGTGCRLPSRQSGNKGVRNPDGDLGRLAGFRGMERVGFVCRMFQSDSHYHTSKHGKSSRKPAEYHTYGVCAVKKRCCCLTHTHRKSNKISHL